MNILITGGSGFIGSTLVENIFYETKSNILNLDKLTYASFNSFSVNILKSKRYKFKKLDICSNKIINVFNEFKPDILLHLAAESHVDNSISSPSDFIKTNILGTYNLLKNTKNYLESCSKKKKKKFKFINFSTDEVFGDLADLRIKSFSEDTKYNPSSPYSASKASADHLVSAWHRTYNIPIITLNSSNNYGPRQHQEKLIPLTIKNALNGIKIPIYGNGQQKRDWIYVKDCTNAILRVIEKGRVGENYNIGSINCIKNIDLIKRLCKLMDSIYPASINKKINFPMKSYFDLVNFVKDRPGHDLHYAINPKKIKLELNWKPKLSLDDGLEKTVLWYIDKYKLDNDS